jgi:hypothetical protein
MIQDRLLILLALVASIAIILSGAPLIRRPYVYTADCLDAQTFARDAYTAYATRSTIYGTYYFHYPVTVTQTTITCNPCLVSLNIQTLNNTTLQGRQRLLLNATSGKLVIQTKG